MTATKLIIEPFEIEFKFQAPFPVSRFNPELDQNRPISVHSSGNHLVAF